MVLFVLAFFFFLLMRPLYVVYCLFYRSALVGVMTGWGSSDDSVGSSPTNCSFPLFYPLSSYCKWNLLDFPGSFWVVVRRWLLHCSSYCFILDWLQCLLVSAAYCVEWKWRSSAWCRGMGRCPAVAGVSRVAWCIPDCFHFSLKWQIILFLFVFQPRHFPLVGRS